LPEERPTRVLCLGAHSDDIEIGCGGTILRLLQEHREVSVCWVVMSASGVRREEAQRSAQRFLKRAAHAEVILYEFRDGFFPYSGGDVKESVEGLKGFEPDLVFTHHREDRHQDHRLLADLTWNTFRDHVVLEYEVPKYDGELGSPNLFVPIDEDTRGEKLAILMEEFASQRSKRWFTPDTFQSVMRLRGVESGHLDGFAEGFFARKLNVSFARP
jgi:LmbE family N-acetylglucosaminyl deacetylase